MIVSPEAGGWGLCECWIDTVSERHPAFPTLSVLANTSCRRSYERYTHSVCNRFFNCYKEVVPLRR